MVYVSVSAIIDVRLITPAPTSRVITGPATPLSRYHASSYYHGGVRASNTFWRQRREGCVHQRFHDNALRHFSCQSPMRSVSIDRSTIRGGTISHICFLADAFVRSYYDANLRMTRLHNFREHRASDVAWVCSSHITRSGFCRCHDGQGHARSFYAYIAHCQQRGNGWLTLFLMTQPQCFMHISSYEMQRDRRGATLGQYYRLCHQQWLGRSFQWCHAGGTLQPK